MRLKSVCGFMLLHFITSLASAKGGWVSGGGDILKDSHNPWFVNSVKEIRYCIEIDEQNFGVTRSEGELAVTRAIAYWKAEFASAALPTYHGLGKLEIATQTFRSTTCDQKVDLKFQFGILDKEQKNFLKAPAEIAAVAVRTDYSQMKLRGRGFIYVSPEAGHLRYDTIATVNHAWSTSGGYRLLEVLKHEMGHVFGLPHDGQLGELMSESYPELLLSPQFETARNRVEAPYFRLRSNAFFCEQRLVAQLRGIVDVPSEVACLQVRFEHNPLNELFGETLIVISGAAVGAQHFSEIARVKTVLTAFQVDSVTSLWVTSSQTVFPAEALNPQVPGLMTGIPILQIEKSGRTVFKDGTYADFYVRFGQGRGSVSVDALKSGGRLTHLF